MNHSEILAFEFQQRVLALVPRKRLPSCLQNCDKAPSTSRGLSRRKGSEYGRIAMTRRMQIGAVVGRERNIQRLNADALFSYPSKFRDTGSSLYSRFVSTAAVRALSPFRVPLSSFDPKFGR